jgi:hypothetical protein
MIDWGRRCAVTRTIRTSTIISVMMLVVAVTLLLFELLGMLTGIGDPTPFDLVHEFIII